MARKQIPPTSAPAEEGPVRERGRLKLILAIVFALLLAIGLSVGGTWLFMARGDVAAREPAAASASAADVQPKAIYEVLAPPFVVNFNHNGRQRYMQVSVALMSRSQAALEGLKEHMPLLRNQLVMLFSAQDFDALMTPVGKEVLRQRATASVQELAQKETGRLAIEQVLFTNFVLQ